MENVSLSLYHYMCKCVVGTENYVKTIRLMNTVIDNSSSNDAQITITSGSYGEGLQMYGSDLDIMLVFKFVEVHAKMTPIVFNPVNTYFSMITEDTKPGFAMLRLISGIQPEMLARCEQFRGDKYLSNALFKTILSTEAIHIEHGPCLSDIDGFVDLASCLHGKFWPKHASRWIIRSNNSWPNENTKQMIISHGVLFVPIGVKGSPHEYLEWRISFSFGEKLLIYTFSHTQLLCYALMKILLKDVINTDSRCKDLLCSYYLKTIMFWVSEELQPSVWTPGNLIPCFMRCVRRLIYCVNYSVCPHYFIQEYNLFENKIEGQDRTNLIETLRVIFSYGWRCMFFSNQISHVSVLSCNVQPDQSIWCYFDMNKLLNSHIYIGVGNVSGTHKNFRSAVHYIMSYDSRKLKYLHAYIMSVVCNKHFQSVYLSSTISNKNKYKEYNTCVSYLLMNMNHDAVSGWLMLASYFYKANQYEKSLIIMVYALSKCTPEKLFFTTELSVPQRLQVKWHLALNQQVVHSLKFLLIECISFKNWTIIPLELLIEGTSISIPPVVYAHFLSFLCNYHLNDLHECRNSLRDLQLTITENYFIGGDNSLKYSSYYCLGTALQLMGDNLSAKQAFTETLKLLYSCPYMIKHFKRL